MDALSSVDAGEDNALWSLLQLSVGFYFVLFFVVPLRMRKINYPYPLLEFVPPFFDRQLTRKVD